jgi:hypothetical protein
VLQTNAPDSQSQNASATGDDLQPVQVGAQYQPTTTIPSAVGTNLFGSAGTGLSTAGSLYNIASGLQSGNPLGVAGASLGAAGLANKAGAFGSNASTASSALGGLSGVLGLASGLEQGGVQGYGKAAVGALQAGASAANLAGDTAVAGDLGSAAGALAVPLSVYSAATGWKQGNYVGNTLSDAEAGAAIGSVIPGIGTAIGAIVGGVVGLGTTLLKGQHTEDNITDVGPNQSVIKLQSGNSALQEGGVALGAGSSRGQGSGQWFMVPSSTTTAPNGTQLQAGTPLALSSQASQGIQQLMDGKNAYSPTVTNGTPDFSKLISAYNSNPTNATGKSTPQLGVVQLYNQYGGQEGWGQSFGDWLNSMWNVAHNVSGNLTAG